MSNKISVIIPVYNRENCIKLTVENALKQTIHDIEIICVDDGSTDKTGHILENMATSDNRVRVFHKENGGAGSARNMGIHHATGAYLFFLDSDDQIYDEKTLELLYNKASKNNADICGGRLVCRFHDYDKVVEETDLGEEGFVEYIDNQRLSYFSRFIYKTSFLKDNKIDFPDLFVFEDPVFMVKALILAKRFYYVDENTYIYCQSHQQSLDLSVSKAIDEIKGITEILNISSKCNLAFLHRDSFNLIAYCWTSHLIKLLPCDNIQFLSSLISANSAINVELLKIAGVDVENGYILPVLEYIWSTSKKYLSFRNKRVIRLIWRNT